MKPGARSGGATGLAEQQAALVHALVADGPLPAGFDAERLAVASHALARKRVRHVHRPEHRRGWWRAR